MTLMSGADGGAPDGGNADNGAAPDNAGQQGTEQGAAQGGQSESWLDGFTNEISVDGDDGTTSQIPMNQHPALSKYGSAEEAMLGLIHAQNMIGKKAQGIAPLGENPTDEERAAYFAALGRPETAEAYELNLPEGMDPKAGMLPQMSEAMHGLGLNNEQASGVMNFLLEANNKGNELAAQQYKERVTADAAALEKEWGSSYGQNLALGERALSTIATPEEIDALLQQGALDDPLVARLLYKTAAALGEDTLIENKGGNGGGAPSRSELEAMLQDPRYANPDKRDPAFVKRVEDGFKALGN
ncbi:MAG: hypothetical protein ACNI27_07385 [Desulfovibrio sp.]